MPVEKVSGDATVVKAQKALSVEDELVPPLLEVKTRPKYVEDRIRLARQILEYEPADAGFLLQQLGSRDFVNKLGALYAVAGAKDIVGERRQLVDGIAALTKDYYEDISNVAIGALGNMGEGARPVLEKLAEGPNIIVCMNAIEALGKIGEKALPALEKLAQGPSATITIAAVKGLSKVGEKALPVLEKVEKHSDIRAVKTAAVEAMNRIKEQRGTPFSTATFLDKAGKIIGLEEPSLTTPWLEKAAGRLDDLAEISKKLEQKFGAEYVGLIVVGSTEKGYMTPTSDLDYAIIGQTNEIDKEFMRLARKKNLRPCYRGLHAKEISASLVLCGDLL